MSTQMSGWQFVILLVVIFFSTNGIKNTTSLIQKIKRKAFRRKVDRLESTLRKHGIKNMFFRNEFDGKIAICLTKDWSKSLSQGVFNVVEPTFVFYKDDSLYLENTIMLMMGNFLFELCNKELPRELFSPKYLKWALGKDFSPTKKTLQVPQRVPSTDETLRALERHLDEYLKSSR